MSEACRVLRLMLVCHVDFLMGELCLGTLLPLAPLASLPEHRQSPCTGPALTPASLAPFLTTILCTLACLSHQSLS